MRNSYYQGPVSDHFDGVRFLHPGLPPSDKSLLDVLKWKLRGKSTPWPEVVAAPSGVLLTERIAGLRITHIGHASYLVQTADRNILVDPVWADRASPLRWAGPRRHNLPSVVFDDLPPIDLVLLSHNHYDHMDTTTVGRLWRRDRPRILTPLGNDTILQASTPGIKVETGDWWTSFSVADGIRLTIVPAYHWSSRGLGDRRMALWGGFVLETPAGVIYCAGDTAYRDGAIFREIGRRFKPPVVAILPIGAYAPRWFMRTQHTDPEEAIRIALDVSAQQILGVHWGTFALTDEPFDQPAERLAAAVRTRSLDPLRFRAILPGDVWEPDLFGTVGLQRRHEREDRPPAS